MINKELQYNRYVVLASMYRHNLLANSKLRSLSQRQIKDSYLSVNYHQGLSQSSLISSVSDAADNENKSDSIVCYHQQLIDTYLPLYIHLIIYLSEPGKYADINSVYLNYKYLRNMDWFLAFYQLFALEHTTDMPNQLVDQINDETKKVAEQFNDPQLKKTYAIFFDRYVEVLTQLKQTGFTALAITDAINHVSQQVALNQASLVEANRLITCLGELAEQRFSNWRHYLLSVLLGKVWQSDSAVIRYLLDHELPHETEYLMKHTGQFIRRIFAQLHHSSMFTPGTIWSDCDLNELKQQVKKLFPDSLLTSSDEHYHRWHGDLFVSTFISPLLQGYAEFFAIEMIKNKQNLLMVHRNRRQKSTQLLGNKCAAQNKDDFPLFMSEQVIITTEGIFHRKRQRMGISEYIARWSDDFTMEIDYTGVNKLAVIINNYPSITVVLTDRIQTEITSGISTEHAESIIEACKIKLTELLQEIRFVCLNYFE